ncbi:MMPL family transporter [Rhodococcus sp. BP-349]|nr:MMPL family transporter [Rhodococcus sp. BP-363]MBY6544326.1 MMPL family transporter [Rhodococcus sp. BP-369]MBY6563556.1 MMPL family transporter [Rhodococcus sp. BP-370]MBY6577848.1 MMPL family transporter [Rhodococcus sp. BP-364]MBY6587149.1 MMPL family transporter [Rhodococcus sp. BP-358]MBY6591486.1 MMPL family transporter [Rhodococcus sp. BP-362]MBY6595180.1 MMPL family transporter [Rhodococcus sp. BP-359]MBY6599519.1 MMPL family transporter [Rhodococcus sp. BP-353]MBY6603856.1 MMPL
MVALLVVLAAGALIGGVGSNSAAGSSPTSLPSDAESARVDALLEEFPDADLSPVILVVTRADGGALSEQDLADVAAARMRMNGVERGVDAGAPDAPVVPAPDGEAAIAPVQVSTSESGTTLADLVTELRTAATDGLPDGLTAQVTGGPAFAADIADSFSGANVTLLGVTALVVALLLIATYRSPVLWLVPLAVVGFGDRVASTVGTAVSGLTGLSFDGSTSGITSVLVFGAGTNYALLLISRYREELRRESDHRVALHHAVRRAGPAIVASNATVVLALLTLLLGTLPSTRSLGGLAAAGLVVAAVFVLFVLPPLLSLFGRKLFWPFVPRVGDPEPTDKGVFFRVANAVGRRPGRAAAVSLVALAVCILGLVGTTVGLSQTEQFRVTAESVTGIDTLAEHFPAGQSDPTVVVARTAAASEVEAALQDTDGVVSVSRTADSQPGTSQPGTSDTGLTEWSVVLDAEPSSDGAFAAVENLRASVAPITGADALVGGSDAQALDTSDAAARDRLVIIPVILLVVLLVLFALLRSALAPLVLVATTVLSTLAALGIGSWASENIFGFPALGDNVPLFGFLFLVALGVDYTIFLVTRAREETPSYGTRTGIVRAVASTGAVITSAGIVLAAVFTVLGVLPLILLTQLGIVVGLGILLDTFVVRTIVIPALFTLIGPRIWWPTELDPHSEDSPNATKEGVTS